MRPPSLPLPSEAIAASVAAMAAGLPPDRSQELYTVQPLRSLSTVESLAYRNAPGTPGGAGGGPHRGLGPAGPRAGRGDMTRMRLGYDPVLTRIRLGYDATRTSGDGPARAAGHRGPRPAGRPGDSSGRDKRKLRPEFQFRAAAAAAAAVATRGNSARSFSSGRRPARPDAGSRGGVFSGPRLAFDSDMTRT